MAKAKQLDLLTSQRAFAPRRITHGGEGKKQRKLMRPLDTRKPIHLVLKSKHAKGKLSLLGAKNRLTVVRIITERARQFKITLHQKQNVGNHIHILASFRTKPGLQNFLRTIAALIAREVTGARRGRPFRPLTKSELRERPEPREKQAKKQLHSQAKESERTPSTAKSPQAKVRFWDHLAFSRVVFGKRDFLSTMRYLYKNEVEAAWGPRARKGIEEFDKADRLARKTARDVWEILTGS